jgi:ribosome biogenesis GTPase
MPADCLAGKAATVAGQVVAAFGRRHLVELSDSGLLECVTRGRRHDVACGDSVQVSRIDDKQGVIEAVAARATLLYRSDLRRQKLICANATQIVIVAAAVPAFSHDLLNRCLIAAEHGGMTALIALNKSDLPQAAEALSSLEQYRALGYRVLAFSARQDVQPLLPHLDAQASVLVGQSGMGKSTIINRLLPQAAARVADASKSLASGKHTTTHARLYRLDQGGSIIDSPGMQVFGLAHLDWGAAAKAMPEFRDWLGQCRFRDCRHLAEPGCAVDHAYRAGRIAPGRMESYRRLAQELISGRAESARGGGKRA